MGCPFGASCEHPSGKVTINAAYVAANAPIVKEQLQKSGAGSRICSMLLWASNSPASQLTPASVLGRRAAQAAITPHPQCSQRYKSPTRSIKSGRLVFTLPTAAPTSHASTSP
jgi:hypothetical protein